MPGAVVRQEGAKGKGSVGNERRTPHLALLLYARIFHAENRPPLRLVDINFDEVWYHVLDFAYLLSVFTL